MSSDFSFSPHSRMLPNSRTTEGAVGQAIFSQRILRVILSLICRDHLPCQYLYLASPTKNTAHMCCSFTVLLYVSTSLAVRLKLQVLCRCKLAPMCHKSLLSCNIWYRLINHCAYSKMLLNIHVLFLIALPGISPECLPLSVICTILILSTLCVCSLKTTVGKL